MQGFMHRHDHIIAVEVEGREIDVVLVDPAIGAVAGGERALEALEVSERYTGIGGIEDVRELLQARIDNFTIVCGNDIVKADTIRFTEAVYDNRRKTPLCIGRRVVSADVLDVKQAGDNTILTLQIVTTKGTWPLKPGTETKRFLRNITYFGVRREPWDNEDRRKEVKKANGIAPLPRH
jgi:hypothetical protein